jgi:hypothetical protein
VELIDDDDDDEAGEAPFCHRAVEPVAVPVPVE